MSITLGVLSIDLKADTASFSAAMDKASELAARTANDVKKSLEKITLASGALVASLYGGTAAMVEQSVNTIGSLNKLSQAAGTTVEKFSVLAFAAHHSGVEAEDLGKGLEKLSRSAFAAHNGNAQLASVFSKLGVSLTDSNGHLRDSSDIFSEVAGKMSSFQNGTAKTAIAMALFGKSGADLIPMMNKFGSQQNEMTEETKKFGLVISSDLVSKAKQYHEIFAQLHAAQEGFRLQITAAVLPALVEMTKKLEELGSNINLSDLAQKIGSRLTTAVHVLGDALVFATQHAEALKVALISAASALALFKGTKIIIPVLGDLASGGFSKLGEGFSKFLKESLGLERTTKGLEKLSTFVKGGALQGELKKLGEGLEHVVKSGFGVVPLIGVFGDMTNTVKKTAVAFKELAEAEGLATAVSKFSGLSSAISLFKSVWTTVKTAGTAFVLLASQEGLAVASMRVLGAGFALIGGWTTVATGGLILVIAAITGLAVAAYKFRDAQFSLKGQTYEIRDIFSAVWLGIVKTFQWAGSEFMKMVGYMKSLWNGFTDHVSQLPFVGKIIGAFNTVISWAKGMLSALGSHTPQWVTSLLDQAKSQREAKNTPKGQLEATSTKKLTTAPETGLGR